MSGECDKCGEHAVDCKCNKKDSWISLKDRSPSQEECKKYHGWFLVYAPFMGRPEMSRYDGYDPEHTYEHGWKYNWNSELTHFMLLPELPKD